MPAKFKIWTGRDKNINIRVQNILFVNGHLWKCNKDTLKLLRSSYLLIWSDNTLGYSDANIDEFRRNKAIKVPLSRMIHEPDFKALLESLQ